MTVALSEKILGPWLLREDELLRLLQYLGDIAGGRVGSGTQNDRVIRRDEDGITERFIK